MGQRYREYLGFFLFLLLTKTKQNRATFRSKQRAQLSPLGLEGAWEGSGEQFSVLNRTVTTMERYGKTSMFI